MSQDNSQNYGCLQCNKIINSLFMLYITKPNAEPKNVKSVDIIE